MLVVCFVVCAEFMYCHQVGKRGYYVYIEMPGKAKIEDIWAAGVTLDDVALHCVFITELMWTKIDPREDAMLISIFDLKVAKSGELTGNALKLFRKYESR
eukprot:GHVU01180912.1.p5 GENE.GHVU01180912.1~~GHVU01180912.1.p5  ORF type:complete len:100 (+),score=17.12 GHVU01180912.1:1055-1354(+)